MQKLITKYGLAAHLAILAVAPLFLSPTYVLWLAVPSAIWLVMEPSRIGVEQLHDARRRVAAAIVRDPVFWLSMVVLAYAGVRWANGGIAMVYDSEAAAWSIHEADLPLMPGSVAGFGSVEFAAALALIIVLQGCRNALGRSARMAFFMLTGLFSGVVALLYAVWLAGGDEFAKSLANCTLQMPVFIGPVFGVYLVGSIVALVAAFERKWRRSMALAAIGIIGNAAGLFMFSPSWCSLAFAAVALICFFYAFGYAIRALPDAGEFKFTVMFAMALVLAGVAVVATLPSSTLREKLEPFKTAKFFPDNYFELRKSVSDVAFRTWKRTPWNGTGLGSFPLDLKFYATDADWDTIPPEQVSPINGYWLLLSERGIISAFLFACVYAFLLWYYVFGVIRAIKYVVMPHPAGIAGLLLLAVLAADAAFDASFTSPGLTLAVAAFLALAANSFPKEKHHG